MIMNTFLNFLLKNRRNKSFALLTLMLFCLQYSLVFAANTSNAQLPEADLYTELSYSINNIENNESANIGDVIRFRVTAGNNGPTDVESSIFSFSIPIGVDIILEDIQITTECDNGVVSEAVALDYNSNTRDFTSTLNIPANCKIIYEFTGEIKGSLGWKVSESSILRPSGIKDPDATNADGIEPYNPHFECYNTAGASNATECNNIQEVSFMLLQNDTEKYLYYEDFREGFWESDDGRSTWLSQPSISLDPTTGLPQFVMTGGMMHEGPLGSATSTYLFAPGQNHPNWANAESIQPNVARILNGYYAVVPPGYVQMGIPSTDPWHNQVWYPDHPEDFYDWTPAWDTETAVRDVSGSVNGAAFLVRGAASASQSIKAFYEFEVPEPIELGEIYTLSLYSYVTYHDRDYMLMDVIDQDTGEIYGSVPLEFQGEVLPPEASPEGFSLGWIPLEASFVFDNEECFSEVEGKNIKIAIRGSQDRALETGRGFGHTLLDDISFTKRSGEAQDIPTTSITCSVGCFEEVSGTSIEWSEEIATAPRPSQNFTVSGLNEGFVLDIYYINRSFNLSVNDTLINDTELHFRGTSRNVRFKSDGASWGFDGIPNIEDINRNVNIDFENRENNPTPALQLTIDPFGNVALYGIRAENGILEELEFFSPSGAATSFNNIPWISDDSETNNKITIFQTIPGETSISAYAYVMQVRECETFTVEKEGFFNDENRDEWAQVGESITYTFNVINAGDMDISDITIVDPLFGFNISLDENTHQVIPSHVTLEGDLNNDGILNKNETWTFIVDYTITHADVFENKGVYNRAEVIGVGRIPGTAALRVISELSTDPTPYAETDAGWDASRPDHTYVPLFGKPMIMTNPMIRQRVK